MPTSGAGTSAEEGFTLVELAVALLVAGLLFGLALTRFMPPEGSGALRADALALAEGIRKLRNHAVSSGLMVRLRLRLPAGAWKAEGMDNLGNWNPLQGSPVPAGELSRGIQLRRVRWGSGKEISEGEAELRILPTGETQEIYLYLSDGRRHERTLTVHPFLNRVDVQRGRVEAHAR
ncbi:MAG: prepilin-type N-terminal cleavage/methylation domain-containing protein [Candidatus Tectomicrobia bacterium]|uniref:Prepilin-type N-terminal cleavage/methylation domain-containing protein n=1 Tax=Tectimicrobiota bacterium TaxID=2528274 RepID=A0A932ML41_UNCTE|nr:prepilin-type N-terminal cleavage/methylation domain-containing protein [Candidatus Tectomicrobia bacterium]